MKAGRYNIADVDAILELHRTGLTQPEIAKRLDVNVRTVSRHLKAQGLTTPAPTQAFRVTPEFLARAEALFADGLPQTEVARTLKCTTQTIARHLPGRAWTPSEVGTHANHLRKANLALRALGHTPIPRPKAV